eukprot:TRINITY_DN4522_c3_g1_i1.p1 TRINITY_DN4522_c3_g1~~TRINITY_DN4522_c3_g1_i1.p1  ORF type:complete len:458 (+),score=94.22 TRINITY_DN4522_c3_g1_i1:57-1430(+)
MSGQHPHETLKAKATASGCDVTAKELAELMDKEDPLREYRSQFHIPKDKDGNDIIYLCGNSLGLQHKGVGDSVKEHIDKWATQAVEGHFQQPCPWFEIDDILRKSMASVVGASAEEVVLMNTLTVNLHLLLTAFYKPNGKKRKILIERNPFPSDMYAIRSQIKMRGCDPDADLIEIGSESEVKQFADQDIIDAIEKNHEEIALVMVAGVHFLTGQLFDIEKITATCKKYNIRVGFDLAHAVGNAPLKLHDWGVDFACWCTYKYLNAGPGNIAGAYIHSSINCDELDRLEGWWGHKRETRFRLKHEFEGTPGVASFQLSNPGVMCMASIKPCLELFEKVGMEQLRSKSLLLTGYLELMLTSVMGASVEILTPTDINRRGAQLSVRITGELVSDVAPGSEYECGTNTNNKASVLQKQLEFAGITCDNRPPDILRLPPVPLYNTFTDVFTLVTTLRKLIK